MKKSGLPVSLPAARPVTRIPQTPCSYADIIFFIWQYLSPHRPSPSLGRGHPLCFVHIGATIWEILRSMILTRSPHIVVVLAPLLITPIIILLLLLPVSIVPIPIATILALVIIALAPTLLVVVWLLVFIDVIVL